MSISKYDIKTKQETLLKGIDRKVAQVKRATYKKQINNVVFDDDGVFAFAYETNCFEDMVAPYRKGYNLIDCALRLNESRYRRAKRVRDKISDLVLNDDAVFITLTFNDDTFNKTDALKRRRLVQRYLKCNCSKYVANVDFGGDKEYIDFKGNIRKATKREHYHALVSNDVVFDAWRKYGAINVERVRPTDDSPKRLSKYITKLTNHALKVEGLQPRLIYSRDRD